MCGTPSIKSMKAEAAQPAEETSSNTKTAAASAAASVAETGQQVRGPSHTHTVVFCRERGSRVCPVIALCSREYYIGFCSDGEAGY
jgi:hypothetical protein